MIKSLLAEIAEASDNPQQPELLCVICVIHMNNVVFHINLKLTVCQVDTYLLFLAWLKRVNAHHLFFFSEIC